MPGASFFLSLSAKTKTFSSKFRGLLNFLFLQSIFSLYQSFLDWLVSIFLSLVKWYISWKCLVSFGFELLFSIVSGANWYFVEIVSFLFWSAFLIKSFGLSLFPLSFSKRLLLNNIFLNSLIFCSAAKAFPPLIFVWN